MSGGNATFACIYSVYIFIKADGDKGLWLLFHDLFLEQSYASCSNICNTSEGRIKRLAEADYSFLSKGVTLGCLQDQSIFTISKKKSYVRT